MVAFRADSWKKSMIFMPLRLPVSVLPKAIPAPGCATLQTFMLPMCAILMATSSLPCAVVLLNRSNLPSGMPKKWVLKF